jgi:hypothetical protein
MVNTTIVTDDDSRKTTNLIYSEPLENLIKEKAEECEVLSKLHLMSHKKYKRIELWFNVPIITITAIVGFVSAINFQFQYMNLIIGVCSLYVSLLKSYFSYLQISQKNENHRVAYLQYYQISNEIRIELSLSRNIRQPANYLLNLIKIKMKNLNEVSELIDNVIISKYRTINENNCNYQQVGKPDVMDTIRPIHICDWDDDESMMKQIKAERLKEEKSKYSEFENNTKVEIIVQTNKEEEKQ